MLMLETCGNSWSGFVTSRDRQNKAKWDTGERVGIWGGEKPLPSAVLMVPFCINSNQKDDDCLSTEKALHLQDELLNYHLVKNISAAHPGTHSK